MKDHFSYEYGYILIDEDDFYLTNTGNWSEARLLKEKGEFRAGHSVLRRVWIALFVVLAGIAVIIFEIGAHHEQSGIYLGILLAGTGVWKVYTSMRKELGKAFYMRKKNIISASYTDGCLHIAYLDSEWKEQQISLTGVAASDYERIKSHLAGLP